MWPIKQRFFGYSLSHNCTIVLFSTVNWSIILATMDHSRFVKMLHVSFLLRKQWNIYFLVISYPVRNCVLESCSNISFTLILYSNFRFGVVQSATQPLQDLYNSLEVEFHPLQLCSKVEATLKHIEGSDDTTALQQYLPSLREITLVRMLQQVAQVYQSICFNRLMDLATFTDAFTLERIIVDCVRHNDMQIRVDHRTRTVHFGSDLTGAQSYNAMEGPHLQVIIRNYIHWPMFLSAV